MKNQEDVGTKMDVTLEQIQHADTKEAKDEAKKLFKELAKEYKAINDQITSNKEVDAARDKQEIFRASMKEHAQGVIDTLPPELVDYAVLPASEAFSKSPDWILGAIFSKLESAIKRDLNHKMNKRRADTAKAVGKMTKSFDTKVRDNRRNMETAVKELREQRDKILKKAKRKIMEHWGKKINAVERKFLKNELEEENPIVTLKEDYESFEENLVAEYSVLLDLVKDLKDRFNVKDAKETQS